MRHDEDEEQPEPGICYSPDCSHQILTQNELTHAEIKMF